MNAMKRTLTVFAGILTTAVSAEGTVPTVDSVSMSQAPDRTVTVSYTLSDGPAVVTVDFQTNVTGSATADAGDWVSIGEENFVNVSGDVNKLVSGKETYSIEWQPDLSWPDHKIENNAARAVVTAWAKENTPDYMVVDLAVSTPDRVKFYVSTNALPGGLLGDERYRTTFLIFKKILAKNVIWTMGSDIDESLRTTSDTREDTHTVQLTNNYYIGVFEVTQNQWTNMMPNCAKYSYFNTAADSRIRPAEQGCSYCIIRENSSNSSGNQYPTAPHSGSFMGQLNTLVGNGFEFDLPSEAEWEFAARAGHGSTYWGDGTKILNANGTDTNLNRLGRYIRNSGWNDDAEEATDAVCTSAAVGSYAPNDFGLYDMYGNVDEWCLDWYQVDIGDYNGRVNADGGNMLDGTASSKTRVIRGGNWRSSSGPCRPAYRSGKSQTEMNSKIIGFRVRTRAWLK